MPSSFEVLLVEDDIADIELTHEALLDGKFPVSFHAVRSGPDALSYLRQKPPFQDATLPDVIFLDLNLPGMSGKEIIQAIRQDENLRHIPIAVLTTSQAVTDISESYELGANCYVSKPVSLDEFNHTVQALEEFWFRVAKIPPKREL